MKIYTLGEWIPDFDVVKTLWNQVKDLLKSNNEHDDRIEDLENKTTWKSTQILGLVDKNNELDNRVEDLESKIKELEEWKELNENFSNICQKNEHEGRLKELESNHLFDVEFERLLQQFKDRLNELESIDGKSIKTCWNAIKTLQSQVKVRDDVIKELEKFEKAQIEINHDYGHKIDEIDCREPRHSTDLEPCPFCGSSVGITRYSSVGYSVGCLDYYKKCPMSDLHTRSFNTEKEAIKAWNKRA